MSSPYRRLKFALCAAALAACSPPPPAAPAPQPGTGQPSATAGQADLIGDWAVQIINQGVTNVGVLRLSPGGDGYTGNLNLEGANRPYMVLSVQVEGSHVRMVVSTPDGDAHIEGNLRAPNVFEGILISRGLNGRFTATRR